MHRIIIPFILLLLSAQAYSQVPAEWSVIRSQAESKLAQAAAEIRTMPDERFCPVFSQDMGLANSNRGHVLIDPAKQAQLFYVIDRALDAFRRVGLNGIALAVNYPLLVEGFPGKDEYLAFYVEVLRRARAKAMTVQIGCQTTFLNPAFGEPQLAAEVLQFYTGLDSRRYVREKIAMMQLIIDSLRPDYLTMEMEPGTMEVNTGHRVDFSVDSVVSYVSQYCAALRRGGTKLCSGSGSWDDLVYIRRLASETAIDAIDCHVYPINSHLLLPRLFDAREETERNGKEFIIGEAWLYKASDAEMSVPRDPVAASVEIFARDGFDYWLPVDTLFIRCMANFSRRGRVPFLSFFWWTLLYGQLSYDATAHGSMSDAELLLAGQQVGAQAMIAGALSVLGEATLTITRETCSGVNGLPEQRGELPDMLHLYPQPASGSLTVLHRPASDGAVLAVHDTLGRLRLRQRSPQGLRRSSLQTDALPAGVYQLTYSDAAGTSRQIFRIVH